MAGKDLKALFVHQLKDTYYAENAIIKALPKLAAAATSDELRGAFGIHLDETKDHVERLKRVFKLWAKEPKASNVRPSRGSFRRARR